MKTETALFRETQSLFEVIAPMLAGRSAVVQGAVVADLAATFIAGHIVLGDEHGTAEAREAMLDLHIEAVRRLIPINAERIHGGV